MASHKDDNNKFDKLSALEPFRSYDQGESLTTNQGVKIADNQNTLKISPRGPSLLEDFIMREKITHFDHERIPERIVHARGEAAHGYFQVYESMAPYTKAAFLQDPSVKTPVFVRFSTVAGSRGSADTVRDVRGFAVKFYTTEGNYDLVGNNIPVFFIQDAIKFPDLVHALKPEPHHEMPQGATAHDTFWDFISCMPESMHMVMWIMSDRTIPRSLRMMEGFGVHTFRFINDKNVAHFVKFHWKPLLGAHALVWDEAQILAGKDPDFHRRDLWESIEAGIFPEWELGVQIIPEADEHKFDFDLLDATKIIPEELVPVKRIGKLVLNRNPENFFAETEQVAFHRGHIVPGIDFTNDPLLQGRLFSYTDTQLSRLGGPNFHEIPINRPICPFHNNQRDGIHRQTINVGRTAYQPNKLNEDYPREVDLDHGGFVSYAEKIDGNKIRARSSSFSDHYTQANLFWQSQSKAEQKHIISAFAFELGKVEEISIRQRVIDLIKNVDIKLARAVANELGLEVNDQGVMAMPKMNPSKSLSMLSSLPDHIQSRKIAFLLAHGCDYEATEALRSELLKTGAIVSILSQQLGQVRCANDKLITVDHSIITMSSVLFDAVFIPGGNSSCNILLNYDPAVHFIREAYRHYKTIAASGEGVDLLTEILFLKRALLPPGIICDQAQTNKKLLANVFIEAIKQHRHWDRDIH